MLDELRSDITTRLEELRGEADKLRRALIALGSHRRAGTSSTASTTRPNGSRASSRSRAAGQQRTPSRARKVSSPPRGSRSTTTKTSTRTAPGATKRAVLAALGGGDAMTAGEVSAATGLDQATVSTTLSRLAKTGEVTKAARGYQAAKPAG
jgi:DNA-binding transcriptional ArsR family regulator